MGLKGILKQHWRKMHQTPERYQWIFLAYNRVLGRNKIRGSKGNRLICNCAKMDRCEICFQGNDNEIVISPGAQLKGCTITITGNHNRIFIGKDDYLFYAELWMSKDNNRIFLADNARIIAKKQYPTHLAAIEGTSITVDEETIISAMVEIRTADGHSIVDMDGNRINRPESITFGKHIWVGTGVVFTKGVSIADDCIIGTRSVVTKSITSGHSAWAGNPARMVRDEVSWNMELIPFREKVEDEHSYIRREN